MNTTNQNKRFTFLFFLIDCIVISILFMTILYRRYENWFIGFDTLSIIEYLLNYQIKSYLFLIGSWFFISHYLNFYKFTRFERYLDFIRKSIFQVLLFSVVLFAISGAKNEDLFSNKQSAYFTVILAIYIFITRSLLFVVNKWYRKKGLNDKNIVIVGNNLNVESLIELINKRKDFGLRLSAHFVSNKVTSEQKLLNLDTFKDELEKVNPDYIYICLNNGLEKDAINEVVSVAEGLYANIGYIPDNIMDSLQTLEVNYLDSFPILTYKKYPLDFSFNQIIKRSFDLIFTLFAFVTLLWWLLPIIALAVYFSQGGPILFIQKRNGLNGKEFNCLKFRTMKPHKMNDLKPTERDDPRVTKLGRILRKTSLDELPQFFNVLKGEMSIVGPRPHMVSENESYSEIINRYSLRHYVKPGITGLAQVRGYRGAVDTEKDMELRIRTDIYYVRNWSFLLDLLIIYKTVKLMIVGDENAI